MKITPKKINAFMLFKLPLGYLSGMRVKELDNQKCVVTIKHRWMNQNPFNSMFWAAQGMAAEMSTGVLVMQAIENSKKKVSMLVTHQDGNFFKKATGKIVFTCNNGNEIKDAIEKSAETKEGQVVNLVAEGVNSDGVVVSNFTFQWSLKVKS
ncbi:DUF4442 domain-containing protein [Polaribacter sp. MED152]|uniref:DUF4442 domain-containing protein n=1 Tax=Polaribacter sp. MED152 TaxID=313598 RepID=UPI000068C9AB|nr:DUF4442 domain-containing protein [Polaribacter sp. MED152]EAQ41726.1 hypothetical protein MED152_03390 [Polaribacter sp. MED152]